MTKDSAGRRSLYLLRHGNTSSNEEGRICGDEDVPLSEGGRLQAARAAELLASCRVDLVLSSPFSRTLDTAREAARAHGVEPEVDEGLRELALGDWSGRTKKELSRSAAFRSWLAAPHTSATPGGEGLEDVRGRAMEVLRRGIARTPERGGLLLVSHGGVIRVLLLSLLGMPLSAYQRLRADPGSVCALEVSTAAELRLVRGLNLGDDVNALRS